MRNFLYVKDFVAIIEHALLHIESSDLINVSNKSPITIKELVSLLASIVGVDIKINWDTSKPEGQIKRFMDTNRLNTQFQWSPSYSLKEALAETYSWYVNSQRDLY